MTYERFIAETESVCFANPWSADDIHALMIIGDCVCETEPEVGYALGRVSFEDAELYRIAVLPEKRRNGSGARLLERFVRKCAEKGAEKVFLEVRSANTPAIRLYERFGFKRISVRKRYYGDDDALIYQYDV